MPTFRKRDDTGDSIAGFLCRLTLIVAAFCPALPFTISPRGAASRQVQTVGKRQHTAVKLIHPNGLALDDRGDLYISDTGAHSVFKLNKQGRLTTVAGTGEGGFGGDGGPAINARLFAPHDLAFDAAGNLLIADTLNHRIRRVDRQGVISTVAGNGKATYAGDGGPALDASLNLPPLVVDTRVARFFPLQIFHLLGFRKRRRRGDKLFVSRRPHDTRSPFKKQ